MSGMTRNRNPSVFIDFKDYSIKKTSTVKYRNLVYFYFYLGVNLGVNQEKKGRKLRPV